MRTVLDCRVYVNNLDEEETNRIPVDCVGLSIVKSCLLLIQLLRVKASSSAATWWSPAMACPRARVHSSP